MAATCWALLLATTPSTAPDALILLTTRPNLIRYQSPSREVTLTAVQDSWSAEVVHHKRQDAPPERQRFMIAPSANKLIEEALDPLVARARWDAFPPEELTTLGLSSSEEVPITTLTFASDTTPLATFRLGAEGYGHRHHYALEADTRTPLLLLDGDLVRLFTHAPTGLLDKDLLDTTIEQSKTLSVTYNEPQNKNLSLTHHPSPEPLMRYWSYTARSPGRSRSAERFASQLFDLRVKSAPVEATDWWDSAEEVLQIELTSLDGTTETLAIRHAPTTSPDTYLARSTRSHHVVTLYGPVVERLLERTRELFENAATETPLAPPRHEDGDGHSPLHHSH